MKENDIEFQLALDEDNIKEALAMATTDEQRERARKAAEYIEQVGRSCNYLFQFKAKNSAKTLSLSLQVKSRRNCLTDPRKRKMPSFKATDEAVKSQVSGERKNNNLNLAKKKIRYTIIKDLHTHKALFYFNTYNFLYLHVQQARDIIVDINNNEQADKLKMAAAAGAAESLRQARTSGFATPGSKSTPKTVQPQPGPSFKPNPDTPDLNL